MWLLLVVILIASVFLFVIYRKHKNRVETQKSLQSCSVDNEIDVFILEPVTSSFARRVTSIFAKCSCPQHISLYLVSDSSSIVPKVKSTHASQIYESRTAHHNRLLMNLSAIYKQKSPQSRYTCIVSKDAVFEPGWDTQLIKICKRGMIITHMLGNRGQSCYPALSLDTAKGSFVSKPHRVQRPRLKRFVPALCVSLQFLFCHSYALKNTFKTSPQPRNFLELTSSFRELRHPTRVLCRPLVFRNNKRQVEHAETVRKPFWKPLLHLGINCKQSELSRKALLGMLDESSSYERIIKYFSDTHFEEYWNSRSR